MFEARLNSKDEITDFVKLLMDHEISFEQKVMSEEAEGKLDTAMLDYSGRFSAEELEILRKGFDGKRVEIGSDYISILLPDSLLEDSDF